MQKTIFCDIDGTIVYHKTIKDLDEILESDGQIVEELLPGVKELWECFDDDVIIITTARDIKYKNMTENIFKLNNLRYDQILFNLGTGPRVLINDTPDIRVQKANAINVKRNGGFYFESEGPLNL